jgi:PAS domain S-box-containing protein
MRNAAFLATSAILALGFVLIAAIGVVAYLNVGDLYVAARRERSAEVALSRVEVLISHVQQARGAELHYLNEGDPAALSEYATMRLFAVEDLDVLQTLATASDQRAHVKDLAEAAHALLPPATVPEKARSGGDVASVETLFDRLADARLSFVAAAKVFEKHQSEILSGRSTAFHSQVISRLIVAGSALAALLLLSAFFVLRRYNAQRMLAEQQVRTAQERSDVALEAAATAVWSWEVAPDRFYLGREWLRMLGGEARESYVTGKELMALVHPEDREPLGASIGQLVGGSLERFDLEYRVRRLDGEWTWIATRGRVAERGSDGRPIRVSGTNHDITRRKQAELELILHDRRLRLALDAARMVGWVWNVESDEWVWQDDPSLLFGPPKAGPHLRLRDMVHPADQVRYIRAKYAAAKAGGRYEDRFRYLLPDGRVRWAFACGAAERGSDGKVFQITGVVQDISEMREAELALERKEQELRQITNAVPAAITYVDKNERIQFSNKAMSQLMGLGPEQVVGKKLAEVFSDKTYQFLRPHIQRALAGVEARYERTHEAGTGAVDLSVTYVPRFDEHGAPMGFYTLASDVTELKKLDRMKSEFVSTVSHELRTPLTSIRGSLGLLAGGVAGTLPDKARGLIEIARNNCERLVRLINDILDMEKIESGKMTFNLQPLDLMALVDQAMKANEGFAMHHGVRLQTVAQVYGARVSGDSDRLIQVLTNLISNACKFSPRDGSVDIAVSRRGERLRVEVIDHGPGISEEFRRRIFQKFSQSNASDAKEKGGTGLGLSISKAIVERLGGEIGFNSEPGQGSSFFFELPELRESLAQEPRAEEPADADHRARVLICEDEADVAKLLQMVLANAGFASDVAASAAEARALLGQRRYAALSLDLRLPDENGLQLLKSLRQDPQLSTLPVVVVSAEAEEGKLSMSKENLGVGDWLSKPIDEQRLIGSLRRALGPGGAKRVLHVENDADVRNVVAGFGQGVAQFVGVETLAQARAQLAESAFDLVLLDLGLPDGSGWELLPVIDRVRPRPQVIVFSAHDAPEGAGLAGVTFLTKSQASEQQLVDFIRAAVSKPSQGAADAAQA